MNLLEGSHFLFFGFVVLLITLVDAKSNHHHSFVIKEASYTRLCQTKKILTVNGEFPGPTIKARKGDTVIVRVYNEGPYNVTLHWHGVDQPRNAWYDGPEYITQCPIKSGANFTYKILLSEEEGTLFWHAHSDWSRATVHGAIIIYPKLGNTFPFPKPYKEIPIILGEWWNDDINKILANVLRTGGDAPIPNAFTVNGQPGDLYQCSKKGTFQIDMEYGKMYLLRVINAALGTELFFAVAHHRLVVVGTDASYTKPLTTDYIMIAPGQTMDVLLQAKPTLTLSHNTCVGRYYIAASAYKSAALGPFSNTTATAILQYTDTTTINSCNTSAPPLSPTLPAFNDTEAADQFAGKLRSLATEDHPTDVPKSVDERMIITMAMNLICPNKSCAGLPGKELQLSASLNNISFVQPSADILGAYYYGTGGIFRSEFPARPKSVFNFTGENLPVELLASRKATEVRVLDYGTNVEVVLQGTSIVTGENHPMHLHGHSFYVVGRGVGNFDEGKDPLRYNLVDPPYQNTVAVPKNGWAAIRFQANNPGVWLMHCHTERHATWGMETVFLVKDGEGPEAQLLPPPPNMPPC